MDAGLVMSLVITLVTLVFTLVILVFTVLVTLLSALAPFLFLWWVVTQMGQLNFQVPVTPPGPIMVKRTVCKGCGAPKIKRVLSAYVYCDYCGELADWDFRAALADKRSKQPGPAYVQMLRERGPAIEAAKLANDAVAYEAVQRELWETYAKVCPASLSPRIGDANYRKRWVAYTSAHFTAAELDPMCQATFAAQTAATNAIQWDRSDPFSPRAVPATFFPLLDAVTANQKAWMKIAAERGLLDLHPDHPTEDLLLRMGTSAFVQGWMPFLGKADQDEMLARTGLGGEYVRAEEKPVRNGKCPSCNAGLEVVEGAKRVVCMACGHLAGVGAASLPCHGCGSSVDLPAGSQLFKCGQCDAELRMMAW
jgi:hypothetical protein